MKPSKSKDRNCIYVDDRPFAWKTNTLVAVKLVSGSYK
jgi:hypothetical protein